jgi:hypothetical protein
MIDDDEDPEVWGWRHRRKNALRVLIVGAVILAAGTALLIRAMVTYVPLDEGNAPVRLVTADPRVVGGSVAVIGAALTLGGVAMFLRAGRRPGLDVDEGLPRAKVVKDRRS